MENSDKENLVANVIWFDHFFGDLKTLFHKIDKALTRANFSLPQRLLAYPKSNYVPSIPPYYAISLGGEKFAVQVFAILNPALLEDQSNFEKEPSFIVVKHSQGDHYGFLSDYGLKIIRSLPETRKSAEGVVSGTISSGGGKGTQFHAFQVLLDSFVDSQNINETIQTEIVDRLLALSDW